MAIPFKLIYRSYAIAIKISAVLHKLILELIGKLKAPEQAKKYFLEIKEQSW